MNNSTENNIQERCLFRRAAKTVALLAMPLAIITTPIAWHMLAGLFNVTNQCSTSSAGLVWNISALANHGLLTILLATAWAETAAFAMLGVIQVLVLAKNIKHKTMWLLHSLAGTAVVVAGTLLYVFEITPHILPINGNLELGIIQHGLVLIYFAAIVWIATEIVQSLHQLRSAPDAKNLKDNVDQQKLEKKKQKLEAKRRADIVKGIEAALRKIEPVTLDVHHDPVKDNYHRKQLFMDMLLTFEFKNRGFIWFMLSTISGVLLLLLTPVTCLKPGITTTVMQVSTFFYAAGIVGVIQILMQQFILFPAYMHMLKRREACCTGSDIRYWHYYYTADSRYDNKVHGSGAALGIYDIYLEKRSLGFTTQTLIGLTRFILSRIVVTWDCRNTLVITSRANNLVDVAGLSNQSVVLAKAHCSNDFADAAHTAYELADRLVQAIQSGHFSIPGYSCITAINKD